jgi:hypothetical protein
LSTLANFCHYIICLQSISGGSLQICDCLVQIGLGAQLVSPCGGECRLTLKYQEQGRLAGVESTLLTGILLLGSRPCRCRRSKARLRGANCLERVSHFDLYELFKLFALCLYPLSFDQGMPKLRLGGPVPER